MSKKDSRRSELRKRRHRKEKRQKKLINETIMKSIDRKEKKEEG